MVFYAVKNGNNVIKGIFKDWNSCEKEVKGAKGAQFKKFKTLEEAENFIFDKADKDSVSNKLSTPELKPVSETSKIDYSNSIKAYVDGSYDQGRCSYGVAFVENDKCIWKDAKEILFGLDMRNVMGEITAAMAAVEEAYNRGYEKITIFHDYEGISKWATGEWKANKKYTKEYADYMKAMMSYINIEFVKVKGHSGDKWNDYVDMLAGEVIC